MQVLCIERDGLVSDKRILREHLNCVPTNLSWDQRSPPVPFDLCTWAIEMTDRRTQKVQKTRLNQSGALIAPLCKEGSWFAAVHVDVRVIELAKWRTATMLALTVVASLHHSVLGSIA
jgi:hypothetical protein